MASRTSASSKPTRRSPASTPTKGMPRRPARGGRGGAVRGALDPHRDDLIGLVVVVAGVLLGLAVYLRRRRAGGLRDRHRARRAGRRRALRPSCRAAGLRRRAPARRAQRAPAAPRARGRPGHRGPARPPPPGRGTARDRGDPVRGRGRRRLARRRRRRARPPAHRTGGCGRGARRGPAGRGAHRHPVLAPPDRHVDGPGGDHRRRPGVPQGQEGRARHVDARAAPRAPVVDADGVEIASGPALYDFASEEPAAPAGRRKRGRRAAAAAEPGTLVSGAASEQLEIDARPGRAEGPVEAPAGHLPHPHQRLGGRPGRGPGPRPGARGRRWPATASRPASSA